MRIIRAERCASGTRIQGARSASQADRQDQKEGLFHRAWMRGPRLANGMNP